MLKNVVVFSALIAVVFGACESPTPIANFDRKQYAGLWRAHVAQGNPIFPIDPCLSVDFSGDDKYTIKISSKNKSGQTQTIPGEETGASGGVVKLSAAGKKLRLTILDTDYKTYSSAYICDEAADTSNGNVGVFLRSTKPDAHLLNQKLAAAQKKLSKPLSPRWDTDFSKC